MKKLLIILLLFVSCKQSFQGYRISNATDSNMQISLSDGSYLIEPGKKLRIVTNDEISKENIIFEDSQLRPKLIDLSTHPDISINVFAYKHSFEVHVFGNSDSVEISINGRYHKEKLPFYYGDETTQKYYIISNPTPEGFTYTYILRDGEKDQRFEHYHGEVGILTNN